MSAACHTTGNVIVIFNNSNFIKKLIFRTCYQNSRNSGHFYLFIHSCLKDAVSFTFFRIGICIRASSKNIYCDLFIPDNIEPVAPMAKVLYRKSEKPHLRYGRFSHCNTIILCKVKFFQSKCYIIRFYIYFNSRFPWYKFITDNQLISFLPDPV